MTEPSGTDAETGLSLDLGHTTVDLERQARTGAAEVIFGQNKTAAQIIEIGTALLEAGQNLLATRVAEDKAQEILDGLKNAADAPVTYNAVAQAILCKPFAGPHEVTTQVAVVSAGTSDGSVAEEAALTAEFLGNPVLRINDVGVAGLHRLLARIEEIRSARVIIVVAGMEGALPSVLGGLVDKPVIAVPTSVGYGASFGGLSALLGMLNTCASGVSVVNIDNGSTMTNDSTSKPSTNYTGELDAQLAKKYRAVQETVRADKRVVVAFSGGVDSSLVAFIAGQELGTDAIAVTSGSRSLKRSDLELAESLALTWGLSHRVIYTDELSKPDYRANPTNRCFHCKTSLYDALTTIAQSENVPVIYNGTNVDDLGDHRPGLIAANDFAVRSPLVDAGFTKADIRALATHLGLENAMKPQSACLSSRFPYGTAIDEQKLSQVESAEDLLQRLGFTQFRVRHHGDVARLELLPEEFELAHINHERINADLVELGYSYVAMDLKGFRSGALNEGLAQIDVVQIYSE